MKNIFGRFYFFSILIIFALIVFFYTLKMTEKSGFSLGKLSKANCSVANFSGKLDSPMRSSKEAFKGDQYSEYCDRKLALPSDPCLCHADFNGTSMSKVKCAMTFKSGGRMGNHIGMYSTLLVLARLNRRPAIVAPQVAKLLTPYFKISLPVMSKEMYEGIKWKNIRIHDRMDKSYANFSGLFVQLVGYPSSNTFFKGFEDELRREFALKDKIQERAEKTLRTISANRTSTTFIGVHVRRGDYVNYIKNWYRGMLADRKYFSEAMEYFRKRYSDAMFVVVSDGMKWCKDNIPNKLGDVYYVGNNKGSEPITDFALLMNCNHSIITIGTYGFFSAFFAGGDVVYFTNFTMPGSKWNTFFHFDTAFPSRWHPIAANLSSLYAKYPTTPASTTVAMKTSIVAMETTISAKTLVLP